MRGYFGAVINAGFYSLNSGCTSLNTHHYSRMLVHLFYCKAWQEKMGKRYGTKEGKKFYYPTVLLNRNVPTSVLQPPGCAYTLATVCLRCLVRSATDTVSYHSYALPLWSSPVLPPRPRGSTHVGELLIQEPSPKA